MTLQILFAFLAGIITVLSPCILPVLPIVLAGSINQGKWRPYGVITGFVASFTFFTLFLASLVKNLGVSADVLRLGSVVVIGVLGAGLLWPVWQAVAEKGVSKLSSVLPTGQNQTGFGGGLLIGLSLGLIWTPCVGPILAAVISLAIVGEVTASAALITLAYSLGTALPMLAIALTGRYLLQRVPWLLRRSAQIQRGFGVLMILVAVAIAFNWDRQFQVWVLSTFPNYGAGLTKWEESQVDRQQQTVSPMPTGKPMFDVGSLIYPAAPDFVGNTGWLNTDQPHSLATDLKGKVVLVDFWTYSCINCIRTFPYLKEWQAKYQDKGFTIIGVHSPEFEFEKKPDNVSKAISDFGINYPVVQDNNFAVWKAYNNKYWPAHYLIDQQGKIRYTHFGEGEYLKTENKIRELLGEPALTADGQEVQPPASRRQSPEIYLGYQRAANYTPGLNIIIDQPKNYTHATSIPLNTVSLQGEWIVGQESITAGKNAQLKIKFLAQQVYLVVGKQEGILAREEPLTLSVSLQPEPLPEKYKTADMIGLGLIFFDGYRKYDIIDLRDEYGEHELTISASPGLQLYAFTFGS